MSRLKRTWSKSAKSPEFKPVVAKRVKPVNINVFSLPWKKSDVVLVVEREQFHVHRAILIMQSPVFEAMLNGHFCEAKQKAITLKGKTSEDMLQFLKLLYPVNMIKKPLVPFHDNKSILKILLLADEFQAEDVMRYLLKNIMIRKSNALELIPYATKYDGEVRKKCIRIVSSGMRMNILEKKLPAIEAEEPELVKELLIAKCRYLEPRLEEFEKREAVPRATEDFHASLWATDWSSSPDSSPLAFQ